MREQAALLCQEWECALYHLVGPILQPFLVETKVKIFLCRKENAIDSVLFQKSTYNVPMLSWAFSALL